MLSMSEQKQGPLLPPSFDQNPELKKKLEEHLQAIPEEQKQKQIEAVEKFLSGELTWAEIKHVPKAVLKQIARIAYDKYKIHDFQTAEILFKGLAIVDHKNWYYRAALGTLFQKQQQFDQAIEEYDLALEIEPGEITTLVNRGICHAKMKDFDAALEDFNAVSKLNMDMDHPWVKKARMLSHAILTMNDSEEKE